MPDLQRNVLSRLLAELESPMMEVHRIHNERDYQRALQIVAELVDADPAPDTLDGVRLEMLATLIERYEAEHFPLKLSASKTKR